MSSDKKREICRTPIDGWIKSVNSNVLKSANDMGKDALTTSVGTRLHERISSDEFGYSLHYFKYAGEKGLVQVETINRVWKTA